MYVELHARSAFSFLEGGSPPEDLIEAFGSLRPSLDAREQHERERMLDAYRRAGGSQEAARRALGLTRAAWRHRWRRFGLAALRGGLE